MRISILPKTSLGRWSVGLAVAMILVFLLALLVNEMHRLQPIPGSVSFRTFFAAVVISGIGSWVTGLISIIKSRERSILAFLVVVVSLFVSTVAPVFGWEDFVGPTLPTQRVSPLSHDITVSAGQSLTFTAAAQALVLDGDLWTLDWVVSGADSKWKVEKRVDVAGGQARESFEWTFSGVGEFRVRARFTAYSGVQGVVEWRVFVKAP